MPAPLAHAGFFLLVFVVLTTTTEALALAGGWKARAKADLLETIRSGAPNEDVLKAVRRVERLSVLGGNASLRNPLLPGNWLMVWTTSDSIAGKTRPKILQTTTPPEQLLDVANGRAVNAEKIWGVTNSVRAAIAPIARNAVGVDFREFAVGPLRFRPEEGRFRGELSVSYLDEDMRISRGDRGNAFVLLRESTQRQQADAVWKDWKASW